MRICIYARFGRRFVLFEDIFFLTRQCTRVRGIDAIIIQLLSKHEIDHCLLTSIKITVPFHFIFVYINLVHIYVRIRQETTTIQSHRLKSRCVRM